MPARKVLSIGQCAADNGAISRLLQTQFGAEVDAADTLPDALAQLGKFAYDLVLVNRVLDADGSSGLEVVRHIKQSGDSAECPVMLVSNYPDAQRQAIEIGALPGFGKASLSQPATLRKLAQVLEQKRPA